MLEFPFLNLSLVIIIYNIETVKIKRFIQSLLEPDEELLPGAEYTLTGVEMSSRLSPLLEEEEEYEEDSTPSDIEMCKFIHESACLTATREAPFRSDFFYDIFPTFTKHGVIVWWVSIEHPLSILMESQITSGPLRVYNTSYGCSAIWSDAAVHDTIDFVINTCKALELKISE